MTAFSPPWPETCWIVSPSTSAAKSATLTSSSFSGRMMAVISFMTALPSLSAGRSRLQGRRCGGRRAGDEDRRADGRAVPAVGGSGDLAEVEALELLLGRDAHPDQAVDDLEEDEARRAHPDQVRPESNELGDELSGVAVEQPGYARLGPPVESAAVGPVGKEAKSDHAPDSVEAVDGDGTDRVVELQGVLDEEGGPDDEDAGDRADQDG